jgi:hypothetical protein
MSFVPSRDGFAFANSWPDEPAVVLATPLGPLNLGSAQGGLCGGMVFAALDYWHASTPPPAAQPAGGSPQYQYVVRRLVDSWHLPAGVTQYFLWMNLPDADSGFDVFGRHVVTERGLGWRTVTQQWPQVRSDLDAGTPAALGVVTVASANPKDLGKNHQVLATSYEVAGSAVTLSVYDPNRPGRDDVMIAFDTSAPSQLTKFAHNLGIGEGVRGFFRTAYAPATPPAA